jgi:hypothetical protein
MKLTKNIRHAIYVKALENYRSLLTIQNYVGLCYIMDSAVKEFNEENAPEAIYVNVDPYDEMYRFKELWDQRPEDYNEYLFWWELKNSQIRIDALTKAIELSE